MKADKTKMFSIPLKNLKAEEAAPFPVYLLLRRNDRFVPIRLPGDPIGRQKYEQFLNKQFDEIWVPNNFQDVCKSYFEYLQKTGQKVQDVAEAAKEIEQEEKAAAGAAAEKPATQAPAQEKSEEALLVRDVMEDQELSTEEKAQVLSAVSQDLLRSLNQIVTRGEPARAEGLKRCKEIADEILNIASQNSNIYDEIIALRNSQEELEHSVVVGTVAVMFALAIGYTDETLLGDITISAIFHDIGVVKLRPEILEKHETKWTQKERKEYEGHVQGSLDILKESGSAFNERVFRMIADHHENYDGSGFPKQKKGAEIDEPSQILHLANLFDRLCTGKHSGTELSPAEAFDYIYDITQNKDAVQEVQPELIERIFQFMMAEKEAAAGFQTEGEKRMKDAMEKHLK